MSENGFLQLSAVFEHEDVFSKMAARYMLYQSRVGYVVTCMYVCMYGYVAFDRES